MPNPARTPAELVRDVMESDAAIRIGLSRGLINVRALARYIQVSAHEQLSFEAILGAIRRYPIKESASKRLEIGKLISKLSMKNEMGFITIRNRPQLPALLSKFSEGVDYQGGETLRMISNMLTTRIVTDSKNLKKLIPKIPKGDINEGQTGVTEIIVHFSENILRIQGVIATVTTELAINGVNLLDASSGSGPPSHVIVLVEDEDALRAYRALDALRSAT